MTNPSPRPTPLVDRVVYIEVSCHGIPQPHTPFDALADLARQLERERAELMEALRECVEDLACELTGRYVSTMDHPAIKPKFERDMKPVYEARALLSRLTEGK